MKPADLRNTYTQAVQIGVLDEERAGWLVKSAVDRSTALAESSRSELPPEVVTIAAVLMSANEGMASVTALAHAERLAALDGIGPALIYVQRGLNFLRTGAVVEQLAQDALARSAVKAVLRAVDMQANEQTAKLEK